MFFGLVRAFIETQAGSDASVVVGAICGEKRQLTSDLVAIDAQRIDLHTGAVSVGKFEIRYTLDGTEPTPQSAVYAGPMPVKLGVTVRALVLDGGKPVLRLAERFAPDEGMHWGALGESGAKPVIGAQAEDARFEGGIKAETESGYNGVGYVDFADRPGWVEWYEENDGAPTLSRFTVKFTATAGSRITLTLNDGPPVPLRDDTAGSSRPGWLTASTVQTLQSGANRIRATVSGAGEVRIDELTVVPVGQ